jgi:hypothetical protein
MEWNALVKPLVYVAELILAAVVTFGTADQLLFLRLNAHGVTKLQCGLNNSMAACVSVIIVGSLCFIGAFAVLCWRLLAAFASKNFSGTDEAILCGFLSIGWIAIAAILTHNMNIAPDSPKKSGHADIIVMRNTVIAFAWLNTVLYIASAVLAFFAPDRDAFNYYPYLNSYESTAFGARPSRPDPIKSYDDELAGADISKRADSIGGSTGEDVAPPFTPQYSHRSEVPETTSDSVAPSGQPGSQGIGMGAALTTPSAPDAPNQDKVQSALRRRQGSAAPALSILASNVYARHSAPPAAK